MTVRVAIPDLISPSYFPAIAAVELGFLPDAKLDLLYPVTKTYEELREGRLDLVGGASHAVLYAFKDWQGAKLLCALAQRDPVYLQAAIAALGNNTWGDNASQFSGKMAEGLLARMMHDEPKAQAAFLTARNEQEKIVAKEATYGPAVCVLAVIDAYLGSAA